MSQLRGRILNFTPNLASFATPYSAADVLGSINTLSKACSFSGGAVELNSVIVIDAALQKKQTQLFFFDTLPTIASADNAAVDFTDANALKCIGVVDIPAANYFDTASNSIAVVKDINLILRAAAKSQDLFVLAVTRGTPTYGSASDLVFRLGLCDGRG